MRVEHKLSPAMQAAFKMFAQQIETFRGAYLAALGTAKEAETQMSIVQTLWSNHIAIIQQAEHLPDSVTPYRLSEDGTKLIGETAEKPAAAALEPAPAKPRQRREKAAEAEAMPAPLVNGSPVGAQDGNERE